jgi:hypothetical protein
MQNKILKHIMIAILSIALFAQSITMADAEGSQKFKNNSRQSNVINVQQFGAKGDGVTDDYPALLKMVNYVNNNGGGNVIFPKGVYYLAPYHTQNAKLADLEFNNCKGLSIIGNDAVISVNGTFKRQTSYVHSGYSYSYTNALIPLSFINCRDLTIKGLEINGNVDKMTRDDKVTEGGSPLIKIVECDNVKISNVYVHHAQTDGIYITGYNKTTTNVTISNTTSANNARQGMSIINVNNAKFLNCKFINTGLTGVYGNHAPSAGVDVEPVKVISNTKTGHLVFNECFFTNNLGSQFVCTSPKLTSGIRFTNCTFTAGPTSSAYALILAADSVVIDKCNVDCGRGSIYPRWQNMYGSDVEIKNCTIKSSGNALLAISQVDGDKLNIHDNEIICTKKGPLTSFFPYLAVKNMQFSNNRIFIPSAALKKGQVSSFVQFGSVAKGNTFYTDDNNIKPNVSYRGTVKVDDKQ